LNILAAYGHKDGGQVPALHSFEAQRGFIRLKLSNRIAGADLVADLLHP
jgi:hypothetical protein